jgi:PHD/YefM family antitoxin component YafN of YafNO toxin-antitoxin module
MAEVIKIIMNSDALKRLVPISLFNRGQATKIFARAKAEGQIVVLKNNAPEAIILSPEQYERMCEIIEDYELLMLAEERLANDNIKNAIPMETVMSNLGITQADIDAAEELEIE